MATTCGFSSGFSSGFDICVAEAAEPTAVARGIPAPPRQRFRRLRPIRIGGAALQFTITTGTLRLQRRVAGRIIQPVEATGRLRSYQRLGGAVLQPTATLGRVAVELVISGDIEGTTALVEGRVGVHPPVPQTVAISGIPVLGGSVTVGAVRHALPVAGSGYAHVSQAAGAVRCAFAIVGVAAAQTSQAVGSLAVACAVAGNVTARPSMAVGSVETDDEAASLMVLGLPGDGLV